MSKVWDINAQPLNIIGHFLFDGDDTTANVRLFESPEELARIIKEQIPRDDAGEEVKYEFILAQIYSFIVEPEAEGFQVLTEEFENWIAKAIGEVARGKQNNNGSLQDLQIIPNKDEKAFNNDKEMSARDRLLTGEGEKLISAFHRTVSCFERYLEKIERSLENNPPHLETEELDTPLFQRAGESDHEDIIECSLENSPPLEEAKESDLVAKILKIAKSNNLRMAELQAAALECMRRGLELRQVIALLDPNTNTRQKKALRNALANDLSCGNTETRKVVKKAMLELGYPADFRLSITSHLSKARRAVTHKAFITLLAAKA